MFIVPVYFGHYRDHAGSFEPDVSVDFRKVPYDYEATATAIEASELPNEFAQIIRTGKY